MTLTWHQNTAQRTENCGLSKEQVSLPWWHQKLQLFPNTIGLYKKNQHRNPIINRLHAPAQQLYQIWRGSMRWYWLYNGKESGLKLLPVCILTISKSHRIPENVHREPCMVKTVHFSTEAKSCAKYEQDPLNIMGCRMVTKRNERKDGCRVRQ